MAAQNAAFDLRADYSAFAVPKSEFFSTLLNAYKEARHVARRFGTEKLFHDSEAGICQIAHFFVSYAVLREGQEACERASQAFQGRNPVTYAAAKIGLGDIYMKMAEIALPLARIDRVSYVQEARGPYVEALGSLTGC